MNNNNQNSSIILISAKSKKQLKEKVKQILNEIESEKIKNDELIDLAYTLQVGREHMEERLAIVINTINELKNKLRSILCEELESIDVYMDSVRKEKYILNLFKTDKELQDAVEKWIERKKYGKLLGLWVKGLNINWDKMYKNTKPKRLSLPTYPFKNERYWIPEYSNNLENNIKTINENKAGTFMLHPLIDKNISTFKVEKFETHLSGKEFYIKDHKVNSENVFPGVAYIEMARAAGEIAGEKKVISMSDMTWIRPLIVDQDGCIAKIYLHPDEEHVSYEVIANRETEKPVKYFEGKLVYGDGKNKTQKFGKIDLIDIKAKCKNNISKESFYKNLENSGLKYGRSFQAINNLFYHNNEALSHLLAPGILDEKFSRFVLHPVLMDGALQTISSLLMRTENESNRMYLPIHIKEIEIFESTPKECYVNVKVIKNINMNDENVKAFSVIIANKKGDILVNMKNVVIKSVKDGLLKRNRSKTSAQIEERKIRSSSISEVLYSLQNGEMKPEQACTLTEDIL